LNASKLRSFVSRLVCLWLFVAAAGLLIGQSAGISGILTDPAGASIPGALVKISEPTTGFERQVETNGRGFFVVQELNPGTYQLRVEKQGFQAIVRQAVVVEVGRNLQIDIEMKVGDVHDSISIEETSGIAKTAASTTVVDRQFVENLPLNGRTFQALIAITPGVVSAPASFETQGQFSVNGERTNANYFSVDGVSANFASSSAARLGQTAGGTLPALSAAGSTASLVSIESMKEFQIQTSAYAAEFGRQPGAQVQIATRSGANQYHGTGFEYLRNDALDANDWFANRNRLGRPPLRQNDFGGVIGGPIKRNRLFFFASEESLRLRQPRTAIVAVPNSDTRSRVPSALKPYVNAIAVPNGADLGNGLAQFAATYSDPTNLNAVSGKIDYAASDRVKLFGRFNYARSGSGTRQTAGFAPNTNQIDSNNLATYTLGSTQVLTPRLANDLRLNYSWNAASTREEVDSFGGAVPVPEAALYPSFTNRNESAFFLQMTTGVGFVDGNISHNRQRQWNLVDSRSVRARPKPMEGGSRFPMAATEHIHPRFRRRLQVCESRRSDLGNCTNRERPRFPGRRFRVFQLLRLFAGHAASFLPAHRYVWHALGSQSRSFRPERVSVVSRARNLSELYFRFRHPGALLDYLRQCGAPSGPGSATSSNSGP
jgi:hypothetical protein